MLLPPFHRAATEASPALIELEDTDSSVFAAAKCQTSFSRGRDGDALAPATPLPLFCHVQEGGMRSGEAGGRRD
jgi:hypothetical protein